MPSYPRSFNADKDDWDLLESIIPPNKKSTLFKLLVKAVNQGLIELDNDSNQIVILNQVSVDLEGTIYDLYPEATLQKQEPKLDELGLPPSEHIKPLREIISTSIPSLPQLPQPKAFPSPEAGFKPVLPAVEVPEILPLIETPQEPPVTLQQIFEEAQPPELKSLPPQASFIEEEELEESSKVLDLDVLIPESSAPLIPMSESILALRNIAQLLTQEQNDEELLDLAKSELERVMTDPDSDYRSELEQALQLALLKSKECGLL